MNNTRVSIINACFEGGNENLVLSRTCELAGSARDRSLIKIVVLIVILIHSTGLNDSRVCAPKEQRIGARV